MKSFLLFLAACLITTVVSAQTLFQSNPIMVADGTLFGSFRPRIVLNGSGNPVVLWGSNIGGYKGFVSFWDGANFSTPFRIHPTSIVSNNVESPQIASKGDTVYIVYSVPPAMSQQVRMLASTDGGLTWGPSVRVDSLNSSSEIATFPSVTTTPDGNPLIVFMRQNMDYSNPRYVLRRSLDIGASFLPIVEATTIASGEACDCCFSSIYAPTPTDVYIPFRRNANNTRDMWAVRSLDSGGSFTQAIDLDSTDWFIPACPSSGPVARIEGDSIVSAYMSEGGDGYARIYLSLSHRDSSEAYWNDTLPLSGGPAASQNHPAIAGKGDTLGLVFEHNSGSGNDIYMAWSTTGVSGLLQNPVVLVGGGNSNQRVPDLKFKNGVFHLVYADNATGDVIYKQLAFYPLVGLDGAESKPFLAYPNPVLHHSQVSFPERMPSGTLLNLLDLQGRILHSTDVAGQDRSLFARGDFPAGIYFLQLSRPGQPALHIRLQLQ